MNYVQLNPIPVRKEFYDAGGRKIELTLPKPGSVEKYGGTMSLTASIRPSCGCSKCQSEYIAGVT